MSRDILVNLIDPKDLGQRIGKTQVRFVLACLDFAGPK
jgi:hypothetical protein